MVMASGERFGLRLTTHQKVLYNDECPDSPPHVTATGEKRQAHQSGMGSIGNRKLDWLWNPGMAYRYLATEG